MPRSLTLMVTDAFLPYAPAAIPQSQLARAPGTHVVTISLVNVRGTEPAIAVPIRSSQLSNP